MAEQWTHILICQGSMPTGHDFCELSVSLENEYYYIGVTTDISQRMQVSGVIFCA